MDTDNAVVAPAVLRGGVARLIVDALKKGLNEHSEGAIGRLACELEEACHAAAKTRHEYVEAYKGLRGALPEPYGEFSEATLAAHVAGGRVSATDAVTARVYCEHQKEDPRKVGRALVYTLLAKDPRFDEATRRDYATRIERWVFNATIARCEESEESHRRQWDSEMFVNVYSGRLGTVAANIDIGGSVAGTCAANGAASGSTWALDRLAAGVWTPEALGTMSETELCPLAGKAERDLVMRRLEEKVTEKTSSLFACPRCHKRHHTYRQVQIGAGDEPSSFMCTCKNCGEQFEGFA